MKKYTSLISLLVASILIVGCSGDTSYDTTNTQAFSTSGAVKGCVFEDIDDNNGAAANGNPIVGADVTVGTVTGKTDNDGCYSLDVTYSTSSADSTNNMEKVSVEYAGFDKDERMFETEHVISGVMADLGDYTLNKDSVSPFDKGIFDIAYANNMLMEGIDGKDKPFEIQISESVELSSTIDSDTIIEILDANRSESNVTISATVSFDESTNILSVETSEAIDAGNYVYIRIPQDAIFDAAENTIESGTENTQIELFGSSLTEYFTFEVRVFTEGDLDAQAVSVYSQMDEDSRVNDDTFEYSTKLEELSTANVTFKNLVKADTVAAGATISNFNNANDTSIADLANTYASVAGIVVDSDVLRFKFIPTNANYYVIKAYDENNVSVYFNNIQNEVNADIINTVNNVREIQVSIDDNTTTEIEIAVNVASDVAGTSLDKTKEFTLKITPYTVSGIAGTPFLQTFKDNVAPTASLQYSYDITEDGVSVAMSGGVTTDLDIYGGSGEISNSNIVETDDRDYTIGTPILNMTTILLDDQNPINSNAPANFITLANDYNASEYAAWSLVKTRSFGIGLTEAVVDIISTETSLTSVTLTSEVNSTNVTSDYTGFVEDIAIVSVDDVFALVNENNGAEIKLNITDLSGNTANTSVVLKDLIAPYIVSSEINTSVVSVNNTITFSENITTWNIDTNSTLRITDDIGAWVDCTISSSDINDTVVTLDDNLTTLNNVNAVYMITFDEIKDLNGNFTGDANNPVHTFRID